jgi:hypothetical protein
VGFAGQLVLGDKNDRPRARQVRSFTDRQRVMVSPNHLCAVRLGSLWCAGMNSHGQPGLGHSTQRTTLTQVGVSTTWAAIAIGETTAARPGERDAVLLGPEHLRPARSERNAVVRETQRQWSARAR